MWRAARSVGDPAGSSIPSPLGTISSFWYSMVMISEGVSDLLIWYPLLEDESNGSVSKVEMVPFILPVQKHSG